MTNGDTVHPAVLNVAAKARANEADALTRLARHQISAERAAQLAEAMLSHGRLTLNFHPDRRDSKGRSVAQGLLADGRYLPQAETGISNGQRFPVGDGARSVWETQLFGDAYAVGSLIRPAYGALDVFHDPYGGAPRFGSSFVVLRESCLGRATFCVGDSHLGPSDVGTSTALTSIVAGAVEACAHGDGFGRDLTVTSLLERLASGAADQWSARELDRYIEAQVHGGIDLADDVAEVVLDPSFRDSGVERHIVEAANRFGFEVSWNEGSEMHPSDIDPEFRGPEMLPLAHSTARADGVIDAAAIGAALAPLAYTRPSLAGDPEESPLQRYKKLWHCCVEFGTPQTGP